MLMLLALPQLTTLLHSLKLVKKALLQMICLVVAVSNTNLELLLIILLLLLEVKTKLFTEFALLLVILLRGVCEVIFT
jgi:multisubunit Na+/H+ antiporter MnhF subunit